MNFKPTMDIKKLQDTLEQYKYQNLPLEQTLEEALKCSGEENLTLIEKDRQKLINYLLDYKWSKLTKDQAIDKIKQLIDISSYDWELDNIIGWSSQWGPPFTSTSGN
jgi:hypothetical protein